MMKKAIILLIVLSYAIPVFGERFYPDKADKYEIAMKGKNMSFFRYKGKDYLKISINGLSGLGLAFFKRNPNICLTGKISAYNESIIEFFGTGNKIYYDLDLADEVRKHKKGDNIWIFGLIKLMGKDSYELSVSYIFDLESDQETFLKWKREVKRGDADGLIKLGIRAFDHGKAVGNDETWTKLGRAVIFEGLQIKKKKAITVKEYIKLAELVMKQLHEKDFAAQIVIEGWKKDKENTDANYYLKHVLRYSFYNGEWLPAEKRYQKEFWDRFNGITYTDDDGMWELKHWVEMNSNRIEDSEEKIFLCAQKTFEMNPAREDAAAFIGKEPLNVTGVTSGDTVTIPRQPIRIETDEGSLLFDVGNSWVKSTELPELVAALFTSGNASVKASYIEWASNLEAVKEKYVGKVKDAIKKDTLQADIILIRGKDYYLISYKTVEGDTVMDYEIIIVFIGGESPQLAVVMKAPETSMTEFSAEFRKVRGSIKFTK